MSFTARQKKWFIALSSFAWFTLIIGEVLTISGYQAPNASAPDLDLFHLHPHASGYLLRLFDEYSYFTNWSVLSIAIVFSILAYSKKSNSRYIHVMMPTSLLMIIVTGILYNLLIAPKTPAQGLYVYTSACEHIITPILAVITWLAIGPHMMSFKMLGRYFVVPVGYVFYTAIRGAIDHQYPYGFLDVDKYGYKSFTLTAIEILIFGVILFSILIPIDQRLGAKRTAASN